MNFSYRLAVLTHGDAAPLAATLASFHEHVTPAPEDMVLVWDGPEGYLSESDLRGPTLEGLPWKDFTLQPSLGFCGATRTLWNLAAMETDATHVMWLEHDFIFTRPVNLEHLAGVLNDNPHLAQVSLMRQPVNDSEKAAGGIVQQNPAAWSRVNTRGHDWMTQRLYYTTTPSLIPISVLRENEWLDGPECEGRMTIDLRDQGYSFGVWGSGETWVEHVGVRTGMGY